MAAGWDGSSDRRSDTCLHLRKTLTSSIPAKSLAKSIINIKRVRNITNKSWNWDPDYLSLHLTHADGKKYEIMYD